MKESNNTISRLKENPKFYFLSILVVFLCVGFAHSLSEIIQKRVSGKLQE